MLAFPLIFLSLTNLCLEVSGLFEYICEERQLFRPYLHVYQGRKGERIIEAGPGFHIMTKQKDIYVCINGPAYLYFTKTTELGQVYEAPQSHVYSHTCEMYNVKPHSRATKIDYELHLMAVLLYGDPEDYRLPSIQRFTAPYFFDKDEYLTDFPRHYQNATSVALIGDSECTLEKGDKDPKIPIKIQPKWPPATAPATPPPPGVKEEKEQYLCRLGFSTLKDAASGKQDADKEKENMRLMVNDEPIRVLKCDAPYVFSESAFTSKKDVLTARKTELDTKWDATTAVADKQKLFDDKVDAAIAGWVAEIAEIEAKLTATPAPSADETTRLNAKKTKLEAKKKTEEDKKAEFTKVIDAVNTAVTATTAPTDFKDATAKTDLTDLETAKKELKTEEAVDPPDPDKIKAAKDKVYAAEDKAYTSAKENAMEISKWEIALSKADVLIGSLEKQLAAYKVGENTKDKKKIIYKTRTTPDLLEIDGSDPAKKICEKLPRLTGEEGECAKGKPSGEKACELFKVTLGKKILWEDPSAAGTPSKDAWKKNILELAGDIFINACPYLPSRRKFVKLINLIMGFYLSSKEYYHKPATGAGTSNACSAFQAWQLDPFNPTVAPKTPDPEANKVERTFWKTIVEALEECKEANRILIFKDRSPTYGRWVWVKPGNETNETEMNIEPYKEQAEKEFVFNWVIDMAWRIFGTTLGMCMPGYETKVPLITSRFYAMFTEDFLIPLRETWVNPKDNLIFQWILGEFYNGDSENWAELCMEASFFYSEREDYRPLRSLLVNCASEHNYFTSGKFVGFTGRYIGG